MMNKMKNTRQYDGVHLTGLICTSSSIHKITHTISINVRSTNRRVICQMERKMRACSTQMGGAIEKIRKEKEGDANEREMRRSPAPGGMEGFVG